MDRRKQVTDLEWQSLIDKIRFNRLQNGEEVDGDLTSAELSAIIEFYQNRIRDLEEQLDSAVTNNEPDAEAIVPTVVE